MKRSIVLIVISLIFLAPILSGSRFIFHIGTMVAIMAILALSMNLMLRIGQLSIAQGAFMGIGGYCTALLTMRLGAPTLLSFFASGLLAALAALLLGPVFLRIKGVYFVLLTYAFSQVVNLSFQEFTDIFGGNNGLAGIPKLNIASFKLATPVSLYCAAVVLMALVYAGIQSILRSRVGEIISALNEDEDLAKALGVNALFWRVFIFAISAAIAGWAGGFYAHYIGFLSPSAFGFIMSVDLLVINTIGGILSPLGPILGSLLLVPLPEILRDAKQYQILIYGVLLMVFLLFLRNGLTGILVRPRKVPQI